MLDATMSGCINHPGVEAVTRCKQCSRPVCGACVETGPTGSFCSTVCRDKHQAFVLRAQNLETTVRPPRYIRFRSLLGRLILIAALLALLGVLASTMYIPLVTEVVGWVRGTLGF